MVIVPYSMPKFSSQSLHTPNLPLVKRSYAFITFMLFIHSIQGHIVCLLLLGFWLLNVVMSIAWFVIV